MLLKEYLESCFDGNYVRRLTREGFAEWHKIAFVDKYGINYESRLGLITIPWDSDASMRLYEITDRPEFERCQQNLFDM